MINAEVLYHTNEGETILAFGRADQMSPTEYLLKIAVQLETEDEPRWLIKEIVRDERPLDEGLLIHAIYLRVLVAFDGPQLPAEI